MNTDRLDLRTGFEERLADLGFDLVQIEWAGHPRRPVIRLRVEHDPPGRFVSLEDCTRVSRHMESWLDEEERLPANYVLEVSSPGVERPLTRDRDFDRFKGKRIDVRLRKSIRLGRPGRMLGTLLGPVRSPDGSPAVRLRLQEGDEIEIPRDGIAAATLVYDWGTR